MKVESCGKNYYFSITYDETREKMINLTAVDGSTVWYGEGNYENKVEKKLQFSYTSSKYTSSNLDCLFTSFFNLIQRNIC